MSIARSITESHGGSIFAYSKNLLSASDSGMIFTVVLPEAGNEPWVHAIHTTHCIVSDGLQEYLPAIERLFRTVNIKYTITKFSNIHSIVGHKKMTIVGAIPEVHNIDHKKIILETQSAPMITFSCGPNQKTHLLTEESILAVQP